MERTCIKLAGIPIGITCQFSSTIDFCRKYLTIDSPQVWIEVTDEDIRAERERDERQPQRIPNVSDAYMETLALYRKIATALVDCDILLFHGSAVCVDGKGYLFTAGSGTGKSTHAALWRSVLSKAGHTVVMINDDKPLLRFTQDGILVCGRINRCDENYVKELEKSSRFPALLPQCYMPEEPEKARHTLTLLDRLNREIPIYDLFCSMDPEAAAVAWEAMRK